LAHNIHELVLNNKIEKAREILPIEKAYLPIKKT